MRTPRRFAPTESASTARCPRAARTRRANRRRRPEEVTGRASFHHPDAIAKVRRQLELLALDRPAQTFLELTQHRRALELLRHRGLIGASDVAMPPLHAAQQLANADLEIRVAARTTP